MTSTSSSLDRRTLLGTTAAVAASSLIPANVSAATEDTTIRPFRINVPEEELTNLRRRVAATRWPDPETVADDSQGVPLATMQELARHLPLKCVTVGYRAELNNGSCDVGRSIRCFTELGQI